MPEKFGGPEEPKNPQEGEAKNEKVITLPNREEMLALLVKVDDNSHLKEQFYPILLESAGQEKFPQGIVMMLALAIYEYTKRCPRQWQI